MTRAITRHFATVAVPGAAPRQVHYRRAGEGPAVLLLHQSPVSSAEYEHLMAQWGGDFTLIAPDTPGFGLSDPLPGEAPLIAPYATAVAEFLDAIGIRRCGVYGTHTGAMIAAEFARAFPDRCEVCVLNGYVVATEAEKADVLANYFVPLTPVPDGSHMVWAWVRMRDQMIFFPWYRKDADARMSFDVPGPEVLQPFVMDFFRSANAGLRAYKAAFTYDALAALRGMRASCHVMAFRQDVLFEHLGRIPQDVPACVVVEGHDTPAALEDRARAVFAQRCATPAPPRTATATIETGAWQDYAATARGALYVRRSHIGAGRPVVLLHDAGASSRQWQMVQQMLHGRRPSLAFDLPGHGESVAQADTPADMAELLAEALRELGASDCDVIAAGAAFTVAAALKRRGTAHALVLIDPWRFDAATARAVTEQLAPDLTPTWFGGHLVEAWAVARDAELFWPWFAPTHANSLRQRPDLDPWSVQHKAVDLLKARGGHRALAAGAAAADLRAILGAHGGSVTLGARAGGPHEAGARDLAGQLGATFIALSDDPSRYAAALAALFQT